MEANMGLDLTELINEIRQERSALDQGDARANQRVDQIDLTTTNSEIVPAGCMMARAALAAWVITLW
jgi:hypothetical protein